MAKKTKSQAVKPDNKIEEELHEDDSQEQNDDDNSSVSSQESVHLPIAQLKNKNVFLTKVGFAFSIYFLVLFGMCIFILLDVRHTRALYRAIYLNIWMWVFFGVSVVIKLVFGFLGARLRSFVTIAFLLDLVLSAFFIIGLYYYLDDKVNNRFSNNAPFVVIYVLNFFVSFFIFTATTFYKSRSRIYNFFIGIAIMILANVGLTIGIMFGWSSTVTITTPQYIGLMFIMAAFDVYIGINAYFIVNYRKEKFLDNDALFSFYGFWVDYLFTFWYDLATRNKFLKKRLNLQKKKKAAKKAKEVEEVKEEEDEEVAQPAKEKPKAKQSVTDSEATSRVSVSKSSGSRSLTSRQSEARSKVSSKEGKASNARDDPQVIV